MTPRRSMGVPMADLLRGKRGVLSHIWRRFEGSGGAVTLARKAHDLV
jgi:hypothetical protein